MQWRVKTIEGASWEPSPFISAPAPALSPNLAPASAPAPAPDPATAPAFALAPASQLIL